MTPENIIKKIFPYLDIKSKKSVSGNMIRFRNSTGLATYTDKVLENFTPIVFGIISQKIRITIEVTNTAITEISSSETLPFKVESSLVEIKLVIVTFKISSANKIVAIIDEGVYRE